MNKYYFQLIDIHSEQPIIKLLSNVEYEDNDIYFVFKDNTRCNIEFILPLNNNISVLDNNNYLMVFLEGPDKPWIRNVEIIGEIKEKWSNIDDRDPTSKKFCVQPYVPGTKTYKYIKPSNLSYFGDKYKDFKHIIDANILFNDIDAIDTNIIDNNQTQVSEVLEKTNNIQNDININNDNLDPISILASKSKKVNMNIDVTINISIPPKSLFNMVDESFENGGDKLIEYILNNIDYNSIKTSVKDGLSIVYKNK